MYVVNANEHKNNNDNNNNKHKKLELVGDHKGSQKK